MWNNVYGIYLIQERGTKGCLQLHWNYMHVCVPGAACPCAKDGALREEGCGHKGSLPFGLRFLSVGHKGHLGAGAAAAAAAL